MAYVPKNRVFEFHVDDAGQFSYLAPVPDDLGTERWNYKAGDTIQFKCNKGPFQVKYVRVSPQDGSLLPDRVSPFGRDENGNLDLTVSSNLEQGGVFTSASKLIDPINHSEQELQDGIQESGPGPDGETMVALFKYLIRVGEGAAAKFDFSRNGMWEQDGGGS